MKMSVKDREKLLDIRKRGKRGRLVTKEEHAFCDRMFKRFPEDYAEVEDEMIVWLRELPWYELI